MDIKVRSLHSSLESYIETVSQRVLQGGVDIVGLSTQIPVIDDVLGGLRNSANYALGGRPGMGKTSLGLTIATNIALQKHPTLFLSLEMSAELLSLRLLSMQTGIPSRRIELGKLTHDELLLVQGVLKVTKDLTFNVIDGSIDSETFVGHVKGYQDKHGLDFLVVDYLSLFRDPNKFGDTERLARISANVFEVSRRCNIPCLSLVQLNREVEKRENHIPILSDIRDSGAIEQDAFAVLFCYRPHYYRMMFDGAEPEKVERDAQIIVAKNRQGEQGLQLPMDFIPERTLWLPRSTKNPPRVGG